MKIELEQTDLVKIADMVAERLKPLLNDKNKAISDLMTVDEVAKHLKVKVSWVYEKIHTKEIPFKKLGRFPRFRKNHIDLWTMNPYHPDLNIYNLNHNGRG